MYNRDSRIMRKLLGKVTPETPSGDSSNLSITSAPSSLPATFRPSKSQNAVYAAGEPILCLDVSPDRRAAVLGGPHILKTVMLDDAHSFNFNFHEGVDVRGAVTSQAAGAKIPNVADQMSIRDVKWHGGTTIITACANGKIFAYNITRIGPGASEPVEYVQMQEDSRQINTLDVNPHLQSWVLSGSQDGMARVFDLSQSVQRSGGVTFRQRWSPLRCIDSVKQVKWSPKVGHEMACCTEGGVVLKWDVRQAQRPLLRLNAHEKACTGIAWHPDGNHLISSGWDGRLHVWDLSNTADKRQKPKYTVYAPAPVAAMAWRPGLWSATAQSKRVAQVAVSYDDTSNRRYGTPVVHIWDLARPTMPYKEIERFDSSPSALYWQDQDMLWTVGSDGYFNQCDVAYAPRAVDRQSTSAMAFSPTGDALMFLDERSQTHRPRPHVTHHPELIPRGNWTSSSNTPMLSISRSDSEEDVIGSFLGPRRRISNRKRVNSARSGTALSTTPPSSTALPEENKQLLGLDQAIKMTGTFKSSQAMASGHIPATKTVHVYQFLSSVYMETLHRELPFAHSRKPLDERVAAIIEKYASAAESASLFRLSQTWRILSYAVGLLLKRRAQYHLESRLGKLSKQKPDDRRGITKLKPIELQPSATGSGEATPRRLSAQANVNMNRPAGSRSLLAEEIESTSGVPTPLARPVDTSNDSHPNHLHEVGRKLAAISEPEEFTIGSPVQGSYKDHARTRQDSIPLSEMSQDSETSRSHQSHHSHESSTEGYDFYDTDVFKKAVDVPEPKKKEPLSLEPIGPIPTRVMRHDSNESFNQMFSISDGNKHATPRALSHGNGPWKSSLARHASDMDKDESGSGSGTPAEETKKPVKKAQVKDSPDEIFMISQTTATDETYPSQTSDLSQLTEPDVRIEPPKLEAPAIAVTSQPSRSSSPVKEPFAGQQDSRPYILETDHLPWSEDPPYPFATGPESTPIISPLDPYKLITRALSFECRTSALNASAIVLLLKPLVPETVIDFHQANGILRQHHSRLMRMGLFVEATLLRNLSVQGWPEGLPEWGDNYPALFTQAQNGGKVAFFCLSCRKIREPDPKLGDMAKWTCERCKSTMAPCAVCGHRQPEQATYTPLDISNMAELDESGILSEWWYCPSCAHGGHASCLQTWHAPVTRPDVNAPSTFSDGCCPLDGCGHACLPGKYRGETSTARSDELGRVAVEKSRSRDERKAGGSRSGSRRSSPRGGGGSSGGPDRTIRSDGNDVPQSRAVGVAREALNKSGGGGSGGGILSSSPGRVTGSGERERRKSVKFAGTDQ